MSNEQNENCPFDVPRLKSQIDRIDVLLNKFSPGFKELYLKDPYYNHVFNALMHGVDVYQMLEQVLANMVNLQAEFKKHIEHGPPPVYIGKISDELYKELKSKGIKDS